MKNIYDNTNIQFSLAIKGTHCIVCEMHNEFIHKYVAIVLVGEMLLFLAFSFKLNVKMKG